MERALAVVAEILARGLLEQAVEPLHLGIMVNKTALMSVLVILDHLERRRCESPAIPPIVMGERSLQTAQHAPLLDLP